MIEEKIVRGKQARMAGNPDARGGIKVVRAGGSIDNAGIFRHLFEEFGIQGLNHRTKKTTRARRLQMTASDMCGRIQKSPQLS